jgi:hypothetical protein
MCVILQKTVNKEIPFEVLMRATERNKDGYGVIVADRGHLVTFRGMDLSEPTKSAGKHAEAVAKALEQAKDLPTMVHFRFATAGLKSLENCHPFELLKMDDVGIDLSFMHNGTLQKWKGFQQDESDTLRFVNEIGRPLLKRFWAYAQTQEGDAEDNLVEDKTLAAVLGEYASSSVFTLMTGTGRSLIINRGNGKEYDWGWASNTYTQLDEPPKRTADVTLYKPGHSFRPESSANTNTASSAWTPPEDWKVAPGLDAKRKSLSEQAEALKDMIRSSAHTSSILPNLGPRLNAKDFLGPVFELEDLAYLELADIRDIIFDAPELAAACFMDLIEMCFVEKGTGKVRNQIVAKQLSFGGSS